MNRVRSASAAAARTRAIEGLIKLGFEEGPDARPEIKLYRDFEVQADNKTIDERIEVSIGRDFPYRRPRVRSLAASTGNSWHREPDGGLCLWAYDNSVSDLPWKDPSVLVERVDLWLQNSATGWPDDLPILDLDRYFGAKLGRFLLSDSWLEVQDQSFFKLKEKERHTDVYEMGPDISGVPVGTKSRGSRRRSGTYGAAVVVGELEVPFSSWSELEYLIGGGFSKKLADFILLGTVKVVVVKYARDGQVGTVILKVGRRERQIRLEGALEPVPTSSAVRMLRSGSTEPDLREKSVAVVGVGAVGSHVADMLVRRGVRNLTLVDGDNMRPGNAVRHLAGTESLELAGKADAVRWVLESYGFVEDGSLEVDGRYVTTPDDAWALLESHDLVVDATAAGECSALFADLADEADTPVVQVALQRGGGLIRVDRYPLRRGEEHHEEIGELEEPELVVEEGCADPVSPTPPDAVVEAAVWAVRMAVDELLGAGQFGPTLVTVTEPQPDEPLNRLGVVVS